MIKAIYAGLCPICHGDLSIDEVKNNLCKRKRKPLQEAYEKKEFNEFLKFFDARVGKARALQKTWAKRILNNESFAAIAPTGIGKSTFGIAMAVFLAKKGKRSYLIFPTTILVQQAIEKINELGYNDALYYYSGIDKENFFEKLEKNDFKLLVTTTQFLAKNFSHLKGKKFDFIFVDDVDSILKASRNVDRILQLLGFYFINGEWKGKKHGILMVSTATAKKGRKAILFRQLLNFDIGSSNITFRNIYDFYCDDYRKIKNLLKRMGKGGIIYGRNVEEAERWYENLSEFKIGLVTSKNKEAFKDFKEGKLDFLIGTAYYYGALIRGVDLPEEIRYAIFIGAPVNRIKIDEIDALNPNMIKFLANLLRDEDEIKKFIPILPTIEKRKEYGELKKIIKKIMPKARGKDFVIRENEIIFPDIRTYIQGSGRTSRLTAGGITKGASFLFENDEAILKAFIERASYFDIIFKRIDEADFERIKKEIEKSRMTKKGVEDIIKPALFIVESPTKAKQIARFFGKPSVMQRNDIIAYEVAGKNKILAITASLGHITDLVTDRGFHGIAINGGFTPIYAAIKKCRKCGYQFVSGNTCPKCGSNDINDAAKRIEAIRKLAYEVGEVIIATDPDAEGEKIAWDIANMLPWSTVKRAEFHEITPKAISQALENLRGIDENMVKAQIVRRIEDRWIGFVLSQKLWNVFNDKNLSAGRAQTPVLGWIIERAEENKKKIKVGIFKELQLTIKNPPSEEIEAYIELKEEKREERNPMPPYTTDTMLRDANIFLKMDAAATMRIAQELFENGLITYHRTDSTRVSEAGLRVAKEYLGENFVARWQHGGGAHECIRPTHPWDRKLMARLIREGVVYAENIRKEHLMLYDLIFRRFMASMAPPYEVVIKKYRVKYDGMTHEEERIVMAHGIAYDIYKGVQVKKELPLGKVKLKLEIREIPLAPLFTQSDVIAMMKERGIGRPSTYATIVEKLFMRKYVIEKNGKIIPTKRGIDVFNYLATNYMNFVSEERTKKLQEEMDMVENGLADYTEILKSIYDEIKSIG